MNPIEADDVMKAFQAILKQVPGSGFRRLPDARQRTLTADDFYGAVPEADVINVLAGIPFLVPVGDVFDCDDYAMRFKTAMTMLWAQRALAAGRPGPAPAIGILLSHSHAVNVILLDKGDDNAPANIVAVLDPSSTDSRSILTELDEIGAAIGTLPIRGIYL